MIKRLVPAATILIMAAGCSHQVWEKTPGGIILNPILNEKYGAGLVRLEVVSDNIIHVEASATGQFPENKSLFVNIPDTVRPPFTVSELRDTLVITTARIKAKVSVISGAVVFTDLNDKILLSEKVRESKSLVPVIVENTSGYMLKQIFDSPADEAFYGLGQHQSDEFNYKGRNEVLYQYNTKVSVPFVVSSRNYGILWDNYSLTKFGDPRDYSEMNLFKLYDNSGKEGGLSAFYYHDSDTTKPAVERLESAIDYENLSTVGNFPREFPLANSRVIWKGKFEPGESGVFHFRLYYAGYVKLYINEDLVVPERWRTAWNPNTYKFSRELKKNEKYSLRVEWNPDGGTSYIGLKVLSPRPETEQQALTLTSEMGDEIDYYFISGYNLDEVIGGYRHLTGKAPIMPKWAMGYWQSRERYKTEKELLGVISEYRRLHIPLDNIVLDWFYWPEDSWGSHEFDPVRFPDPSGMVRKVHEMNANIMISVWPKFYVSTEHFREFESKGWMYMQAVRDSIRDWVGKGYVGSFYDAYNPEARALFWNQMKEHLYIHGFDAWWMDASEPDIQSNASLEYRKKLTGPTALGPSAKYFNAYALMNAQAIYNGQRSADPDTRVFLLTRSGFPGLQKYSTATWSGDIGTRWEDMKAQISAGLNYAMSGIPYWTMDIGGFCVENRYFNAREGSENLNEWRELNSRWYQFGAFCPLFRSHGQFPYREVYNLAPADHPAFRSMVYADKLRYRLMPYIYSLAGKTYFDDYTIMRALVMDFNGDPGVLNIGDQYMFGPSVMVAPVYTYKAVSRNVYFPSANGWYDFYSGKFISGGQTLNVDAPYERIPLFIKEGSVIPVGPEIEFTSQKPADMITLWIYTGRDAEFILYEDEGVNYNYEKGAFSTIKVTYNEDSGKLTIGDSSGTFNGMLKKRTFHVIGISRDHPVGFDPQRKPDASLNYEGKTVEISLK